MRKNNSYRLKITEEHAEYLQQELQVKRRQLLTAREEYDQVIHTACEAGMSNTAIGKALGVTEASVRMWRKRHG